MAYELSWIEPGRILGFKISDHHSDADIAESITEILAYLEQGVKPVHFLVDLRTIKSFPPNVVSVYHGVSPVLQHDKVGWYVVIGNNNTLVNFFVSTVTQIARSNARLVSSHEEAMAVLQRIDPSLAPQARG